MGRVGEAGRSGLDVRSDCKISIELKDSGGNVINIKSKVSSMYGESIKKACTHGLEKLGVINSAISLEDSGAVPFVILARLEAAVKRADNHIKQELLPEMLAFATYKTSRERFRRSRLYLPGNEPRFFLNAGIHKPDGIILDLEDAVAPAEKDAARIIVRNALMQVDFMGAERMVRINQLPLGYDDLASIIPYNVHVVLIPKCEDASQVRNVDERINQILENNGINERVFLMPIIESALGALRSFEIAQASKNIVALAIGLEDYTADIGTQRTLEGKESFFMRSMIVNVARACGIQPIDTVFSDVEDMEGLRQSVLEAKGLGFDGKGCIHPRQIRVVNDAFAPNDKEIERAKKIMLAFDKATKEGLGVVSLGSKMIDPPVVKRALRTIELALASGKLVKDWKERG